MTDNLVPKPWASAQGETGAKVSFLHGPKGLRRTPNTVRMPESQAQLSPLCWVQTSSLTLGRARRSTVLIFFYGNNRQKSLNKKKNNYRDYLSIIIISSKLFSCMLTTRSGCSHALLHILLELTMGFCSLLEKCKEKPT